MTTSQPSVDVAAGGLTLPGWLVSIMQFVVVAGLPLVLILLNARVLMTNTFLRWEYNLPNFPPDPYGFTQEDRLELAPPALDYLFNSEGIEFLGEQTFPDGQPLYNERELSHMHDVKVVTRQLSIYGYSLIGVTVLFIILMAFSANARDSLYRGLFSGSILTVALIITGLITVATSFNWLFTQFHGLFFEGDSWIFLYSDTLIRLFPIEFWTHAFALMLGGALLEALLIGGAMWFLLKR